MRLLPERSVSEDKTASDCISQFIALLGMTVLQLFPYMEVCPLIIQAATIWRQITAANRMPREISPPRLLEPIHWQDSYLMFFLLQNLIIPTLMID